MSKPIVFISYSHLDEQWKDRVVKHLGIAEKQGLLQTWNDRNLLGGEDWFTEIISAIERGGGAVLLVSYNSLTSDFILNEEVPRMLARHKLQASRFYPIVVEYCDWGAVEWLKRFNLRPRDGRPVGINKKGELTEVQINYDLAEIAKEIRLAPPLLGPPPAPEPLNGECPYVGLEAFTEDKEHLFFGRDDLANTLFAKVRPQNFVALIGVILLFLVLATAGMYLYRNRQPILTDKDTILLTDFVNTTGDPVFDGALKQGLAVQLEQSPFLNIFSDERVRETLRFMGRSPDERVTLTIGREICQRQGLKAMLTGSIASLGRNYVISLEAVNSQSGDVLAREQSEAEDKEQVLRSLGELATRLREKLGESLSSIQKFDAPLVQATTSSLEALKVFALGHEQHRRGNSVEAIPLYQRAIELDPNFAYAYVNLGLMYSQNNRQELVNECLKKAFELRERVSERERLRISQRYYAFITGEIGKASEVALMWKQLYPRDETPYSALANSYFQTGQFEKAIEELRVSYSLKPEQSAFWYAQSARALMALNRLDEAKAISELAINQKLDSINIHTFLYNIAFIHGDTAAMQQQVDWASGRSGEHLHLIWQADKAAFAGQFRKAREFSNRAAELAQQLDLMEAAGEIISSNAVRAAILGHCQQCRADLASAAVLRRTPLTFFRVGVAYALCGNAIKAQSLNDEAIKQYPKDTVVNEVYLPLIRAAIELERSNRAQGIQILQAASRYESVSFYYQNYLRGQAYLGERKGIEAAAEFQKILDHRGWAPRSHLYPLAHLGLGRAAVIDGDTAKARKSYEDFFALWKDADAELPSLLTAKQEYSRLR